VATRVSLVKEGAGRVLIVANPHAGAGAREAAVARLLRALDRRGLVAERVSDLEHAEALAARDQAAGELLAVVAAGGDGTVAEIVNRTHPDVPITVYPLGTANLLASYLRISDDPDAFVQMLIDRATVRLDAASANGRVFLLMAGCGFDAEVVKRLHRQRVGRGISYWTYARPILETIRDYEYPALRMTVEPPDGGEATTLTARWAFVVNLPCYAGGVQLAPEAVGTDGLLDLALFRNGSLWHGLRYLGFSLFGRQRALKDFRSGCAARVRIESDRPVPYQLDGDPGGMLPLEIHVLPGRMHLLAPAARVRELAAPRAATVDAGAR